MSRTAAVRVPDPAEINAISRVILLAEASAVLEPYLHRRADFGADVIALLDQGRLLAATDYINAQSLRRVYQREWAKVWNDVDFVFTPTSPTVAPKIGQTTVEIDGEAEDVRLAATRLVRALNVIGLPALSVPLATESPVPIGLQIIGKPFDEPGLLSVSSALL
jgi:aspartyl-tRNA(Asn)/glutamyl-tRNA(Gln) amidotransferase subunit A